MNKERYIRLMDWGKSSQRKTWWIHFINQFTTDFISIVYPILLMVLVLQGDERLIRAVFVPAISFVLVSIFRHSYDEKRPYIVYEYEPVIRKDKVGKSMPSRHVFSAFIVAMTFLYIQPFLSIPVFLCAVAMCFGRVISGVHYTKDVIVGTILGIGLGIIGFYLI